MISVDRRLMRAAVLAALALVSGCYTTTVRSGKPPATATIEYDERWHHGFVLGIAEVSGPYDLSEACPAGWAEIETETSFLNGLVEAVTSGIYSPQTVTVRCARPAAGAPSAAPLPTDAESQE